MRGKQIYLLFSINFESKFDIYFLTRRLIAIQIVQNKFSATIKKDPLEKSHFKGIFSIPLKLMDLSLLYVPGIVLTNPSISPLGPE